MATFKQQLDPATAWKNAVTSLWKRQRIMLGFTIPGITLTVLGIILLWTCIGVGGSLTLSSIALVSFLIGVAFIAFSQVACYFLDWWFFFDLVKWRKATPKGARKGIALYFSGLIIILLLTMINLSSSSLYLIPIPYINLLFSTIAGLIQSITGIIWLLAFILLFAGLFSICRNLDMPSNVRKGTKNILVHYAVKYGAAIIGCAFIISAVTLLMVTTWWATNFGAIENTVDATIAAIDTATAISSGETDITTGISDYLYGEYESGVDDTIDTMVKAFTLSLIGVSVFVVGYIIALFLRFRGWKLIANSELEVAPTPATFENIDDTCCNADIEESVAEVISE